MLKRQSRKPKPRAKKAPAKKAMMRRPPVAPKPKPKKTATRLCKC